MPHYCLCGLHIASDFALPGVPAWQGVGAPDVTISPGHVPDHLPGARGNTFQVAPGERVRVQFPRVGAFLVEGGRRVTLAAAPAATGKDIALFLLGSIFGLLCHQRGLFPLHASAIDIGGQAVAFAGDSGAGKSTTAAALVQLGHLLLSDDISVIDLSGKSPMLVSTSPTQKLWRDSLLALDIQAGGRVRPQLDMDKFERHVGGAFGATPRRLAAIYHLETARMTAARRLSRSPEHRRYKWCAARSIACKQRRRWVRSAACSCNPPRSHRRCRNSRSVARAAWIRCESLRRPYRSLWPPRCRRRFAIELRGIRCASYSPSR